MEKDAALRALGAAMQERRRATGLSQDRFADLIGMHRAYYGALERGNRNLTFGTLLRVCAVLEVSASVLLAESGL